MRIILAQWSDGRVEPYKAVTDFLHYNPGRNYDTIMSYMSRKKEPYSDGEVKLSRVRVLRAAGAVRKKSKTKKGAKIPMK